MPIHVFAKSAQDHFRDRVARLSESSGFGVTTTGFTFVIWFNCGQPPLYVDADHYKLDDNWLTFHDASDEATNPVIRVNASNVLAIIKNPT